LFVESDVIVNLDGLSFAEVHTCDEVDGWLWVRQSGIATDFHRVIRLNSGLSELRSYQMENAVIREVVMNSESGELRAACMIQMKIIH
jgi:hypothetical protein